MRDYSSGVGIPVAEVYGAAKPTSEPDIVVDALRIGPYDRPQGLQRGSMFTVLILNYEAPEKPSRRRWRKAFTLAPDEGPVEHFGETRLPGKYGHRLTRERYALVDQKPAFRFRQEWDPALWDAMHSWFEDDDHQTYTEAHCAWLREEALENFDLNMAFFAQISQASFDAAISSMLKHNKQLLPVTNLRELDGKEGLYVMVLDGYRQTYIGQSKDMRRRIRSHWAGTKKLDRLVFGTAQDSVMPIDAFRTLDTTRIFAAVTSRANALEARVVRSFPADYRLNRIDGGTLTGLRAMFIENEINRRRLSPARDSGTTAGSITGV